MKVWIYQRVLNLIKDEAFSKLPNETGGILMGYWSDPYREVVITNATGPGPQAEHASGYYKPDNKWQHGEAIKIFEKLSVEYLGDWHSHTYPSAFLSRDDIRTLKIIARYKQSQVPYPLMLILHDVDQWDLTIWKFSPTMWTRIFPTGKVESMDIQIVNK